MTNRNDLHLAGTEAFEAVASALFAPLRVIGPGPQEFQAVVDHTAIGPVVVARIQATAGTVMRDNRSITSSDVEWMHFTLHHHGPLTATQDDRTVTVRPGELFACDNTRPYRLIGADPSDMTVLCVPRASLGRHANSISRRTALPISPQGGIGSLLGHALFAVNEDLPRQGVARTYLADALTALLLAAFSDTTPERVSVASELVDRIRSYALAHLGDPQLGAETVARQHRISVRHLHALFKGSDLTFAAWVRHERLLRIRRDLLAPASSDVSTATIAARWGVHDTKHLGRALKREFGETVSDLRRGQQAR
ncbi:AraC-like ligand-binding domain-containing protein [Streptomyces rishiriensis]|uniref:AraC-like DNA-binding protein n=1 Tax=Streptomyces rishiriensis TaxID=68264 RepID=A0ABU0NH80_STRRH|nr:helix-turn-helix domain-containing protein [Streptomyces rishiriensis]MDQ0578454.1 AraC-like DNA-binding protein [Streptomyces rishiriensis]